MKYAVTVLFDASRSVTVEADTPEEAEGKAHNEVGSASLCHQCSDEIDMGDATGALVYADDGDGPQVLDTTYSGETIARLQAALAAAEARNATLTDDAARLDFMCNKPARFIDVEDGGWWRVYEDQAPPEAPVAAWRAIVTKHEQTPREAIDAAIQARAFLSGATKESTDHG